MPYVATPRAVNDIHSLLDTNWDNQSGNVPEPFYVVLSDNAESIRIDLTRGDYIVIRSDTPTLDERPIGTWVYGDQRFKILLEVLTIHSRQRLYDLEREIRRICHSQMHSMTNFQRIQFMNFVELTQEEFQIWKGRIIVELLNSSILLNIVN